MTKYTKISFLLAALLLAGSTFAAEREQRPDRMHQRGPEMGTQLIEHLGKAMRRLDLSDEQKETIRADMKGLRESIKPLVKQVHEGRKELHGLITGDAYDKDAAAGIAEQQGKLTSEITMIASETAARVLARLSDEQRAELTAMGEKRRTHRTKHMEKMKARKMEHRDKRGQDKPEGK
jgi:Spy/CpxP family protein refolding chaperone